MEVLFFTTNDNKIREGNEVLNKIGVKLLKAPYRDIKKEEIREEDVRNVALAAAKEIVKRVKEPFIVEDSGLYIEALNGFPAAYSSWVFKKIGCSGILKLMEGERARNARFLCALAYSDGKEIRLFSGVCEGTLAHEIKGQGGFGYDPIFIPIGETKTFAEDETLKKKYSHRTRAFNAFATWLLKNRI
jgi:XTP/dITP diphosphohydrolase